MMKKLLCVLLSLIMLLVPLTVSLTVTAEEGVTPAEVTDYGFEINKNGVIRLEAEDVDVTNYVISSDNPSKIVERADASNGKFLAAATGNVSSGQYFTFKFTLAADAEIVMSAAYAQSNKWKTYTQEMVRSYTYVIDGTTTIGLSSNYVLPARDDITTWDTCTYDKVALTAGEHTVTVRVAENTGRGNPNIDYLDFAVTGLPETDEIERANVVNYGFDITKNGTIRLEAEDVDVTHYVISSNNPSKIVEREDASNGKFLAAATGNISSGQYFEFSFTLAEAADIVLSAAYAQTEGWKTYSENMTQSYTYVIDGSQTVGLTSNYTLEARDDITIWDTITYDPISLPAGTHTVRVSVAANTGRGNPNIDYIDFAVSGMSGTTEIERANVVNYSFNITKEGVIRLEAEDVDVTNYVISSDNPSKIVEREDASNGKFLAAATGNVPTDRSQYFTFKFNLAKDAEIVMTAAYAQSNKWKTYTQEMVRSYTYIIDENKNMGLSSNFVLPAREDITVWDTCTYDKFTLPAGEHTILAYVAENTQRGNPNIDYMDFNVKFIEGGDEPSTGAPANDIHTDLQYAYINNPNVESVYDYATGVTELSIPKAIVCDFSGDAGIGTASTYIIQKSATPDFSNPTTVTGLTEKQYGFYNLKVGEKFYWRGGTSLATIANSPVHEMTVNDLAPRLCYIDGISNVRDIGGYSSYLVEGGRIRQGLYYRGARPDSITERGKAQMRDDLGVKVEIDMRDSYQCTGPYVDGVAYYAVSIPSGTESRRFEQFAEQYRQIYTLVANADNAPIYLHCTAGSDRTGIATFMLLTVCGASYEDIARDYLFTNFSTQGARYLSSEFVNWWNKLDQFEGETKADKAKNWMLSKGVTEEQVEHIRTIFVEGYGQQEFDNATISAPTVAYKNENFEITITTPENIGKLVIKNENDMKISKTITSVQNTDDGVVTNVRLAVGTARDKRTFTVYDGDEYLGKFTMKISERTAPPTPTAIVSVDYPDEIIGYVPFRFTVVTTKDLVKGKLYTDTGSGIKTTLVSRTVNGEYATSVYESVVNTAKNTVRNFTFKADFDKHSEFPYSYNMSILVKTH